MLTSGNVPDGFKSDFYNLMGGNASYRAFISSRRSVSSIDGAWTWAPMFSFGIDDVFAYINISHSNSGVMVGAGNGSTINWSKEISFTDHTHSDYALTGHTHSNISIWTDVTADGYAFSNAGIVSNAHASGSNYRAGYGFHNSGVNGCFLYLGDDSNLHVMRNSGVGFKLLGTNNFTVSDTTLTITY